MSRKQVTEMVEQTYTLISCDVCAEPIPPDQMKWHDDDQPKESDMHWTCYRRLIKEALSKYPLQPTKETEQKEQTWKK